MMEIQQGIEQGKVGLVLEEFESIGTIGLEL